MQPLPEAWPDFHSRFIHAMPLSKKELTAFLDAGKNRPDREYYLRQWQKILAGGKWSAGFHWPAFFFGALWCIYRRMYICGGVVLILENLLLPIFLASLIVELFPESGKQLIIIFWIKALLIVRLVLGFLANRFYLDKSLRIIGRFRKSISDEQERLVSIYRHGGVSHAAVAVAIVLIFLIRFYSKLL